MIAFGSSITMPEVYARCAGAGIRRVAEPDAIVIANAAAGSIARSYNLILDSLADRRDLEAVVLVHQDAEIIDPGFCATLRQAFGDPNVAVVGCVGAARVESLAWWDGDVSWNGLVYRYGDNGGGELAPATGGSSPGPGEVETVYGVLMALSPWAARTLRFDEALGVIHGYDYDLCRQARAAGREVRTVNLQVVHHHSLDLVTQTEPWAEAHMRAAEKWDEPDQPLDDAGWRSRARVAEAEAAAARLLAASKLLQAYAVAERHNRELRELSETTSWRLTEPLRRGNALLRRARARRRGRA